jgi:hypothetical protein
MAKFWPANSMPAILGAPCCDQSDGVWQTSQLSNPWTRYLPRASRSGVRSNCRLVSARARGPMNGLQPMVNVIATASSTTTAMTLKSSILPVRLNFLISPH